VSIVKQRANSCLLTACESNKVIATRERLLLALATVFTLLIKLEMPRQKNDVNFLSNNLKGNRTINFLPGPEEFNPHPQTGSLP
jgi:hypothetical protein